MCIRQIRKNSLRPNDVNNTSALSTPPLRLPVLRLVTSTEPTVDTWPPEYPDNKIPGSFSTENL